MGYEEFGKLIESGDAEAVAKVFNAMEGQAQQLMLSYLTDEQLEKLSTMLGGDIDDEYLNDEDIDGIFDDEPDTDEPLQVIYNAINEGDTETVCRDFRHLDESEQNELISMLDDEQQSKLSSMLENNDEYPEFGSTVEESKDVNGDGDTDMITADTNGNGEPDTAVAAGDDTKEEKDAVKAAKEDLGLDGEDDTSTGKKKKELDDEETTVSDKKQKDTCSDSRQKNILSALSELRF